MVELSKLLGTPPRAVAKHAWLKQALVDHIEQNLSPGDWLPSERELAEATGVSRMTARRALNQLVAEGRVHREVGRGSFVASQTINLPLQLMSFTAQMADRGLRPGAKQISSQLEATGPELSLVFGVSEDEPLLVVHRLRTADDEPMAIERAHLLASLVPGLVKQDLTDRSIYQILARKYGVSLETGVETIRARNANEEEAKLLDVRPGAALLHFTRTTTWRGQVAEFTVSSYRGDRYELSAGLLPPSFTHPGMS